MCPAVLSDLLCFGSNKILHCLNFIATFAIYYFLDSFFIPHFEIPVYRKHKNVKKINSLHCEQTIIVINMAPLFALFTQDAITITPKYTLQEKSKPALSSCHFLRITSDSLALCMQPIHIMYTTLKFYLFSAPSCEEIKHVFNSIYHLVAEVL